MISYKNIYSEENNYQKYFDFIFESTNSKYHTKHKKIIVCREDRLFYQNMILNYGFIDESNFYIQKDIKFLKCIVSFCYHLSFKKGN